MKTVDLHADDAAWDAAGLGRGRKAGAGVVEVDCLKVCPKRAVVVVDAAAPRRLLVVTPDTPVPDLARRLGLIDAGAEGA